MKQESTFICEIQGLEVVSVILSGTISSEVQI